MRPRMLQEGNHTHATCTPTITCCARAQSYAITPNKGTEASDAQDTARLARADARGPAAVLAGTAAEILAGWPAAVARLAAGDELLLVPEGGVLRLPPNATLQLSNPIIVSGAPTRDLGGTGAGRAGVGAPRGAAQVQCGEGAEAAVVLRWGRGPWGRRDQKWAEGVGGGPGAPVVCKLHGRPGSRV